jgi:hypothetical protein
LTVVVLFAVFSAAPPEFETTVVCCPEQSKHCLVSPPQPIAAIAANARTERVSPRFDHELRSSSSFFSVLTTQA